MPVVQLSPFLPFRSESLWKSVNRHETFGVDG
jgi:hypothetical protein